MKLVRVNGVSLINLKKTLGSQTITVYGTTYFAAARSAVALRILSSCARLELHCCLELKPNGGQKGYHRMSTLRLERFDFVISALWGMGFTNWICVTSPVSDQAYFTFWKPAKVRQTENEHLFWLDNFFSRSLHVLALEQIEIFSTKLSGSDKRPSKLQT